MIWSDKGDPPPVEGDELAARIVTDIAVTCGSSCFDSPDDLVEIAGAVELFLREDGMSCSVGSREIAMLASRAFISIGEDDKAKRLLMLATGLVVPSGWDAVGDGDVWSLDLLQIFKNADITVELLFFSVLNRVLDVIADIWDDSDSRGVIGLKHLSPASRRLLGASASKRRINAMMVEIFSSCERKLDQISSDRNWSMRPGVLNMDIVRVDHGGKV